MVWQIILNGFVTGSIYFIIALSFGLTLGVARFFNFSHAAVIAAGPYFVFALSQAQGKLSLFSMIAGVLGSSVLGYTIDRSIYRKLRSRNATSLSMLLASLGLYVVLQNILSIAFGDDPKGLSYSIARKGIELLGGRLTIIQILMIFLSAGLGLVFYLYLRMAPIGRKIRAISDDPELSLAIGIDNDSTISKALAMGAALGGLAGILIGIDTQISPSMGMSALLGGVVVVVVGGTNSIAGSFVAAHFVGQIRNLSLLVVNSEWQDAILFSILVLFLLVKPQGIAGYSPKTISIRG